MVHIYREIFNFCSPRLLLSQIRRSKRYFLMPTKTCLTSGKQIIFDPLHGSDDVITALASCTDGQRIVTAAKDSTIKVIRDMEFRDMELLVLNYI